mmetsp:Transcript_14078/g.19818  ORF Transcript_14078/g.19818 Transcript_14078/m.19818 type:complete len:107 (-) Transcript_14078:12-332(-)
MKPTGQVYPDSQIGSPLSQDGKQSLLSPLLKTSSLWALILPQRQCTMNPLAESLPRLHFSTRTSTTWTKLVFSLTTIEKKHHLYSSTILHTLLWFHVDYIHHVLVR